MKYGTFFLKRGEFRILSAAFWMCGDMLESAWKRSVDLSFLYASCLQLMQMYSWCTCSEIMPDYKFLWT